MKITVLGAGAWGTAIACAAAAHHAVVLWARDAAQASHLRETRRNERYLSGIALPESLSISSDLSAALAHANDGLIVIATPTAALRETVRAARDHGSRAPIAWLCKGFERESGELPHQVVAAERGEEFLRACAGPLSGPSFAMEVARGLPTALTVAGASKFCATVTRAFHAGALRVYSSDDVIGVEVGGAVKNVLAIATGISDALALGANARAALITRGLAEITRLGVALGARAETFMGLTGVGDLFLTCTGELSRNRTVGLMLGRGVPLTQALAELGHVAEGVRTAPAVLARASQAGIEMPITAGVCAVLEGRLTPQAALEALLAREPKGELE
ncbi:MAG: NAD(P)H-dependent glycerol-3-phosphate dehydrogenase [Burkholderiaceae bacterium]